MGVGNDQLHSDETDIRTDGGVAEDTDRHHFRDLTNKVRIVIFFKNCV